MRNALLPAIAGFVLAAVSTVALPAAANAATAATTTPLNMRAGPGLGYPVVSALPAGAPVTIFGCVRDGTWCDTAWGPQRGWVAGAYLTAVYRGAPVVVGRYWPRLGYPVVVYNQNVYWDRYYVGRPWYARRHVFIGPNHQCFRGLLVTACR